jgi:anti-anti-sigma regulatory factor
VSHRTDSGAHSAATFGVDYFMLDITVSVAHGLTVVGLKGALVRKEGEYLIEVVDWLHESGERRITLHAAGVTAVDIDGVMALMQCHSALTSHGGSLIIKMPSGQLRLVLNRTGLDAVLRIVDDPDPLPFRARVSEV